MSHSQCVMFRVNIAKFLCVHSMQQFRLHNYRENFHNYDVNSSHHSIPSLNPDFHALRCDKLYQRSSYQQHTSQTGCISSYLKLIDDKGDFDEFINQRLSKMKDEFVFPKEIILRIVYFSHHYTKLSISHTCKSFHVIFRTSIHYDLMIDYFAKEG